MNKRCAHPQAGGKLIRILTAVCLALLLQSVPPVNAQHAGHIQILGSPVTDKFPLVQFYFEPFAADGSKINDIAQPDLQVLEESHAAPVTELNRYQPGLDITIAINVAPELNQKVGDSTFYTGIQSNLTGWAQRQPPNSPDQLSIITNSNQLITRVAGPGKWVETLKNFRPSFADSTASLQSLIAALDSATDTLPNGYMRRAILFITAKPSPQMLEALPNLTKRAAQLGVPVTVWLISPGATPDEVNAAPLQQLTNQTGGEFFIYKDLSTMPDYEQQLGPLRYLFQAGFRSASGKPGERSFTVVLSQNGSRIVSEPVTYQVLLQAVHPIFLEPPAVIERKWQASQDTQEALFPAHLPIKVVYDFPDGYDRMVTEAVLYANGVEVARNNQKPFEIFSLPLQSYEQDQEIRLHVKAKDELGLIGEGAQTVVAISVEQRDRSWLAGVSEELGIIPVIALALVGAVVLVSLVMLAFRRLRSGKPANRNLGDPLTQPVFIKQENSRNGKVPASREVPSVRLVQRARLVKVSGDEGNRVNNVFLLSKPIYTFGSSPDKATCVLDFPSVESLHARMTLQDDESYMITDQSDKSGTWVNYSPVPTIGTHLKDGDLIHFGKLIYRYETIDPSRELTLPVRANPTK